MESVLRAVGQAASRAADHIEKNSSDPRNDRTEIGAPKIETGYYSSGKMQGFGSDGRTYRPDAPAGGSYSSRMPGYGREDDTRGRWLRHRGRAAKRYIRSVPFRDAREASRALHSLGASPIDARSRAFGGSFGTRASATGAREASAWTRVRVARRVRRFYSARPRARETRSGVARAARGDEHARAREVPSQLGGERERERGGFAERARERERAS